MPDAKRLVAFLKALEFTTITRGWLRYMASKRARSNPIPNSRGQAGGAGRNGETVEPRTPAPLSDKTETPEVAIEALGPRTLAGCGWPRRGKINRSNDLSHGDDARRIAALD